MTELSFKLGGESKLYINSLITPGESGGKNALYIGNIF